MGSFLPAAVAVLAACATTSVTPPTAGTLDLPRLSYPALHGHTVKLAVLDQRAERGRGGELVRVTAADVEKSLARAGVAVGEAGDAVRSRGDGSRRGTAGYVDRCVRKSVTGLHTGDRALEQAYAEAMTELLSRLDQLR